MKDSKIEWTDHTFNPWIGCTRVSPGCVNCYAETMMADRYKKVKWGPQGLRVRTSTDYWKQPFKWNRQAAAEGIRRRVFCASLADVFEDKADQREDMDEWRLGLWNLILATPYLDWLLLTKRTENVDAMIPRGSMRQRYPANVWIGTSVEDQQRADERIPHLLAIPAAVRFLSVEPLLGPVDLTSLHNDAALAEGQTYLNALGGYAWDADPDGYYDVCSVGGRINWVICGGESGPKARPMHSDWARSLRDQCQAAGVPFFMKQNGEFLDGVRVGKKRAGRLLDGREWDEFPEAPSA